jgi:hypothetical protein
MTTIEDLYNQFNVPAKDRFSETVSGVDVGDYTFTDMDDDLDTYLTTFTNKDNPDVIVRIDNGRAIVNLLIILDDENVEVTSWRYGNKVKKVFPRKVFRV